MQVSSMQTRAASQNGSLQAGSSASSVGSGASRRSSLAGMAQAVEADEHDGDRPAKRTRLSREASNTSERRSSLGAQPKDHPQSDIVDDTEAKPALDEPVEDSDVAKADGEDESGINVSPPETNDRTDDISKTAAVTSSNNKKPWQNRRKRKRGFAAQKKSDAANGAQAISTTAEGTLAVRIPGTAEPGEILKSLAGRRRAPHADPSVEADLRRQLELKVAYRLVVKALKPVLIELATRTVKENTEDHELHKKYPEYADVMKELGERLETRLSVLSAWFREEEARLARMKDASREIIYNQFASKFQEMRENMILECKHQFLSVVRTIEAQGDDDATDDEDGVVPRLYHHDIETDKRWGLEDKYDSRSRVFIETERLWDKYDARHHFRESQKQHFPESLVARPKGFSIFYDQDTRREAVARLNLNLLTNAGKTIEEQQTRAAFKEVSNEAAVGLQALAQASDIAATKKTEASPAKAAVSEKVDKPAPKVVKTQKRSRSPDPIRASIEPPPKKIVIEKPVVEQPPPPKKLEETFEPLSFKPSERGERPFDLPMAASTDTRLPPDPSASRHFDLGVAPRQTLYARNSGDRPLLPPIVGPPSDNLGRVDDHYRPRQGIDTSDYRYHHSFSSMDPRSVPEQQQHPHSLPPLAPAPMPGYASMSPHMSVQREGLTTRIWEPGPAPRKRPGPRPHYSTHSPSSFGPNAPQPQYSHFANAMGPPMFAPQYVPDPSSRRSPGKGTGPSSPGPKHDTPSATPSGRKSGELREIRAYVPGNEIHHGGYQQNSPTTQLLPRPIQPNSYPPPQPYTPYQQSQPGSGQYDPVRQDASRNHGGQILSPRPGGIPQRSQAVPLQLNPTPEPAAVQHSSTPPGGPGMSGSPRYAPGSIQFAQPFHPPNANTSPPPMPTPAPPPGQAVRSTSSTSALQPAPPVNMQHPGQSIGGHQPILPAFMDPSRSRPAPAQPPPQSQFVRVPSYVSEATRNQGSMSVFSAFTPPRRFDSRLERGSVPPGGRSRSPATRGTGSGRGRGGRKAKDTAATSAASTAPPASALRASQTPRTSEPATPLEQANSAGDPPTAESKSQDQAPTNGTFAEQSQARQFVFVAANEKPERSEKGESKDTN